MSKFTAESFVIERHNFFLNRILENPVHHQICVVSKYPPKKPWIYKQIDHQLLTQCQNSGCRDIRQRNIQHNSRTEVTSPPYKHIYTWKRSSRDIYRCGLIFLLFCKIAEKSQNSTTTIHKSMKWYSPDIYNYPTPCPPINFSSAKKLQLYKLCFNLTPSPQPYECILG